MRKGMLVIRLSACQISCVLAIATLGICAVTLADAQVSGSSEATAGVEEFVHREEALWQQRHQGQISEEEWGVKYTRFILMESERLQSLMPGILETLGERLEYRSGGDRQ